MILIVGLGNPGPDYEQTRHNLGFWALDSLAKQHHVSISKKDQAFLWGKGKIADHEVALIKPTTYMNESGKAVKRALTHFTADEISIDNVYVLCDEVDLEFGRMKIKKGGSDGGHKGIRSISAHIGPDYYRLRLGIGRPPGQQDVADFVLDPFKKAEKPVAMALARWAGQAVEMLLKEGLTKTQNYVHQFTQPPESY